MYQVRFSLSSEPVVYYKGLELAFIGLPVAQSKHGLCLCRKIKKTKWRTDLLEVVTCPITPAVGRPWLRIFYSLKAETSAFNSLYLV